MTTPLNPPFAIHQRVLPDTCWQGTFPHHLFSITLSGGCIYRNPQVELEVEAGDLLSFSPCAWQDWQTNEKDGWEVIWMLVDLPHRERENWPPLPPPEGMTIVHLEEEDFMEARRSFEMILRWNHRQSPVRETIILHQLQVALLLGQGDPFGPYMDPRVERALRFLSGRLHLPTTLDDICFASHSSRPRLSALFKDAVGKSPLRHLEQMRLEEAARRLRFSFETVEKIAQDLSFNDRKHLDKRFKLRWGISPAAYRQQRTTI